MSKGRCKIQSNSVLAFAMTAFLFLLAGLFFDFYYDLNDDVLIKDIVSGAYSGHPDAHSIQMLYPVSLLISLLYRLVPALPWQGLFLCGCHGVCFYLIDKRSLSFTEKKWTKAALLVTEAVLILTLFMWELVVVQYTITAALLAACACFLVLTERSLGDMDNDIQTNEDPLCHEKKEKTASIVAFLKKNAVAIALVILAFNIRSEMLLLMSPFIALTGIFKWSEDRNVFAQETIKKYVALIGAILVGLGLSLLIDATAYSGQDWKIFRDFFNARTQVYDYTWYPEYEEAEKFYRSIGATPAKVTLIDNYNFGLDDSIDAELLWDIAAYAEGTNIKEPLIQRLKEAVVDYKWRTFHEQDAPYNFLVLTAYCMVAALALVFQDKTALWKLPLAVVFRTIPWMYVILANRVPARISHPLYYIEFIILCAWMFSYYEKNRRVGLSSENTDDELVVRGRVADNDKQTSNRMLNSKYIGRKRSLALCAVLLLVYSLIQMPGRWQNLGVEMERRESVNTVMREFDAYAGQNPENYYYMDVYSTVDFSEKMFVDVDNSQKNYDILGGWASGSPLQKNAAIGFREEAFSRAELLLQDNFYFVIEEGRDISFLDDFYHTMGIAVTMEPVDEISGEGRKLIIYRISPDAGVHHE